MEHQTSGNGLETFLEHWSIVLVFLVVLATVRVFVFFLNLSGGTWIRFFLAGAAFLISGAALMLHAKIPVYRSGRFFTFGVKSVPEGLAGCYRWGWRVFLAGVALSLCLLLSRH